MIKARLKKLRFATLGFLVLLLALSPVSSVFAVGLGHGFYGTVKINGMDADIGTVISAKVGGTEYGSCTVTTLGSYALIVQGEIADGATIHFYVDGQEADQTFPFHDGWTTKLDLTVTTLPMYPTVTTQAATDITTNSTILNMSYTVGDCAVDVRFAYKESADSAWSYTDWVSKTADGSHDKMLTGLDSDTDYDFKAQLKYDTNEIEGDELQFTTTAPSGCFIATAAYGTPTAEQIDVLREFRDMVLLESTVGSQFVALYYQLSPPVADFISGNELLRTLVRELLVDPIVWAVEATGDMWQN